MSCYDGPLVGGWQEVWALGRFGELASELVWAGVGNGNMGEAWEQYVYSLGRGPLAIGLAYGRVILHAAPPHVPMCGHILIRRESNRHGRTTRAIPYVTECSVIYCCRRVVSTQRI